MLTTLLGSLAVALVLPLTPFAAMLGFGPIPLGVGLAIAALVIAYLMLAEMLKRWALPVSERGPGRVSSPRT